MVYLPTWIPSKSTKCTGKYASPMDPEGLIDDGSMMLVLCW